MFLLPACRQAHELQLCCMCPLLPSCCDDVRLCCMCALVNVSLCLAALHHFLTIGLWCSKAEGTPEASISASEAPADLTAAPRRGKMGTGSPSPSGQPCACGALQMLTATLNCA